MKIAGWVVFFLLGMGISLYAQFPRAGGRPGTTNYQSRYGNNNRANPRGGAFDPLTGTIPGISVDSLGTDSTAAVVIDPDTRKWDRKALFLHKKVYKHFVGIDISQHYLWDEVERIGGFVRSLGLVGKPYEAYLLGVNERYLNLPLWQNPVMGRYNRYMIDPEGQTQYFDTHTPYVNLSYTQGPARLLDVDVTASLNIKPRLNASLFYERRRTDGIYRGSRVDHTQMYLSSNFHTKDKRYYAFGSWIFNELTDGINGGILRKKSLIDNYQIVDGIIQENNAVLNTELIDKNLATNIRSDASRKILTRSLYLDHYYHLIKENDTIPRPHRLTLRNSLLYGYTAYGFADGSPADFIDTSRLASHLIPVYPTLSVDSLVLNEALITRQFKALGGASYTYDGLFRFNLHGDLNYQRISFLQDSSTVQHNITEQNIFAELDIKRIKAEAELRQRTSNLYKPARQFSIGGTLLPFSASSPYYMRDSIPKDSAKIVPVRRRKKKKKEELEVPTVFNPLSLSFHYYFRDIQPTLFQSDFQPRSGSTYIPNAGLNNQQITQLIAGVRYNRTAPISRGDTLMPNYFYAKAYLYRHNQMIYYSSEFELLQAGNGEALTRIGAEVGVRIRFMRRLHWETEVNVQRSTISDNAAATFAAYGKNLPTLYGKTSLFYDIRNIKIAKKLRIGMDLYYNNSFQGMTVDPLSGEFFPVSYQVPSYLRADVYFSAQLRAAHLFIRYIHVNEGLMGVRAYYTTPFYPMLERSLTLGVNWPFFD